MTAATMAMVDFMPVSNEQGLIEMVATFALELSQNDVAQIRKIGHKYCWSDFLLALGVRVGKNAVPERKAWDFLDAVYSDTEDGRKKLPLATTPLAEKVWSFLSSLV